MIIAIDGPAGSGKSSTARAVAARLGFQYLDTGAMYRAVTLKCLEKGIAATDHEGLEKAVAEMEIDFTGNPPQVRTFLDGRDVTEAIRSDEVTKNVSDYCMPAVVRAQLVSQQRRIASRSSVVCEGRDIGTVVFPDADLKFFMLASVEERARRRRKDFAALGISKSIEELVREITARDAKDSTRENSPLVKAPDAEEVDTTSMTLDGQIEFIVNKALVVARKSGTAAHASIHP
ncbi:MAG: (d)CMP kinase [Chitinispirillaceae bacterium]|nr:(d)CMP kinase [Chitinispirillaceae bacterium]